MSDYRQKTIEGQSWVRSPRFYGENPITGGTPSITYQEEEAISLGEGDVITRAMGSITQPFVPENYNETFPLLDPQTGAVIGEATFQQLFIMLHSHYYHTAGKRDAGTLTMPSAV